MIEGISHLTFIVKNLERAATFFKIIFDAQEIYSSGEKTFSLSAEKFFLVNGLWICVMEGDPLAERTYNHVAFQIPDDEYEIFEKRLSDLGLDMRLSRPRVEEEGRSLYFYDFDNHLFELHTGKLSQRLKRYQRKA
ncbi:MAG: FosX/FosE/FosI family fosfomycin resistance thiol transferase [Firmicutes bacterium HGW-Firmicutes-15]|nr:MAG: FosX/FosE/FosI family fosfomycin resistance thiol transferase [Firmicutes bacterium HGW-Firmicutes-15]